VGTKGSYSRGQWASDRDRCLRVFTDPATANFGNSARGGVRRSTVENPPTGAAAGAHLGYSEKQYSFTCPTAGRPPGGTPASPHGPARTPLSRTRPVGCPGAARGRHAGSNTLRGARPASLAGELCPRGPHRHQRSGARMGTACLSRPSTSVGGPGGRGPRRFSRDDPSVRRNLLWTMDRRSARGRWACPEMFAANLGPGGGRSDGFRRAIGGPDYSARRLLRFTPRRGSIITTAGVRGWGWGSGGRASKDGVTTSRMSVGPFQVLGRVQSTAEQVIPGSGWPRTAPIPHRE